MQCEKCGVKIMPALAREQKGGENLCRACYTSKLAKENESGILGGEKAK